MFLLPSINMKLRPKILNLRPGTRIVSNTFTMEDWTPDETFTVEGECTSWCTALLWIVPAKVAGSWQLADGTLRLKQQFQQVSGSLGSQPISDGKLRGSHLTFNVGSTTYSATVAGNTMTGAGGKGGAQWKAAKMVPTAAPAPAAAAGAAPAAPAPARPAPPAAPKPAPAPAKK